MTFNAALTRLFVVSAVLLATLFTAPATQAVQQAQDNTVGYAPIVTNVVVRDANGVEQDVVVPTGKVVPFRLTPKQDGKPHKGLIIEDATAENAGFESLTPGAKGSVLLFNKREEALNIEMTSSTYASQSIRGFRLAVSTSFYSPGDKFTMWVDDYIYGWIPVYRYVVESAARISSYHYFDSGNFVTPFVSGVEVGHGEIINPGKGGAKGTLGTTPVIELKANPDLQNRCRRIRLTINGNNDWVGGLTDHRVLFEVISDQSGTQTKTIPNPLNSKETISISIGNPCGEVSIVTGGLGGRTRCKWLSSKTVVPDTLVFIQNGGTTSWVRTRNNGATLAQILNGGSSGPCQLREDPEESLNQVFLASQLFMAQSSLFKYGTSMMLGSLGVMNESRGITLSSGRSITDKTSVTDLRNLIIQGLGPSPQEPLSREDCLQLRNLLHQ